MLAPDFLQPRLTHREIDTLIALRSAGLVSAPQLARLMALDPDNTRKRLRSLVAKGYALRVHLPRGYRYFAASHLTDPELKSAVADVLRMFVTNANEVSRNGLVAVDHTNANLPEIQPSQWPQLPQRLQHDLPDLLAQLNVLANPTLPALPRRKYLNVPLVHIVQ